MERSIDRIVDIGLRKIPMQDLHTQYPQKVNVWAGIIDDRILGPFFLANNLTGDRYLQFLQLELMPALAALFPNANITLTYQIIPFGYKKTVLRLITELM
jgi:hypothetical protein